MFLSESCQNAWVKHAKQEQPRALSEEPLLREAFAQLLKRAWGRSDPRERCASELK